MAHSIRLTESAYRAYERRAKALGLSVEEYLSQSAPSDDDFVLTPEARAGIERGLQQAVAGQLIGIGQVRETLANYRAEWRKKESP